MDTAFNDQQYNKEEEATNGEKYIFCQNSNKRPCRSVGRAI